MMRIKRFGWIYLGFFALMFVVVLFRFLDGLHVLTTTDAAISGAFRYGQEALLLTLPNWRDQLLLGNPASGATQIPTVTKSFTPAIVWNNWSYVLGCLLSSLVFSLYFRRFKKRTAAIVLGAVVGFWTSSNLTLLYAGHNFKVYVVMFFVCTLMVAHASTFKSTILWGAFCGLMFVQQPDVAMLFALFAGAYLLFRLWQEKGTPFCGQTISSWLKVLVPAAVVALLFAAGPLLSGYKQNVKNTAQVQTETSEERWQYITQWSMPPEEMIDFVAPNYTGIRSGEPDGPYWGRMGRSEGWEQHHQGFMNYRMESLYLGIIPVGFALFAIFSCYWSRHRAEIIFWAIAALVALLLSFGKYFPLYALFYQLPVVNNIRNPNKFLQVFQVCLAILTVYGVDGLFGIKQKTESRSSCAKATADKKQKSKAEAKTSVLCPPSSALRWFFWGLVGCSGILLLAAFVVTLDRSGGVSRFAAQGWPRHAAQAIVGQQIYALWHAVFMAVVLIGVFSVFTFKSFAKIRLFRNWLAVALVLIVAVDAIKLSRDYIKEMPRSYIDANPLTEFLRDNLEHDRVALVQQQGIYNIWLTYLLPYNRIPTFNFPAMPRMPIDYKRFLEAGSKNPLRMWQFSAVKYLLAPSNLEKQVPPAVARKVFTYSIAQAPRNNVRVVPTPKGEHAVFELQGALPRYALLADYKDEDPEAVLARLGDSKQSLMSGRLIENGVEVVAYRPGRVELKVQSDVPAMLRAAERWDPDWVATVDDETTDVQRIDFLCQGVNVPAGEHDVILTYKPSKLFFYMQMLGYAILLVALVAGVVMKRRGRGKVKD